MKQRKMAQPRKRMLMHEGAKLTPGPTLDMHSQVISAYDLSNNSGWCNGLNKVGFSLEALEDLAKKQVSKKLDWNVVGLSGPREHIGRGSKRPKRRLAFVSIKKKARQSFDYEGKRVTCFCEASTSKN